MHYLLAVRFDEDAPPQTTEAEREAMFARTGAVNDEMKATGCWVFAGGLTSSESATVVRVQGGTVTTTDGPYAETKEQIAGFWVLDLDDLDAALAWAARCTQACEAAIEVRPFDGLA